jgi:hypothetical protein
MKRTCRVINGETVWEPPFSEAEQAAHRERLAEMLETGQTPFLMTDSTFLAGQCNGSQFDGHEQVGDILKKAAEEVGVNVKGKVYKSGLARFPSDPEAWISGRGDAQRVFEKNLAPLGYRAEGAIKGSARQPDKEPPPPPALADDLVIRYMQQEIAQNPEAGRDLEGLQEKVIDQHAPKKRKAKKVDVKETLRREFARKGVTTSDFTQ